MDRIICKISYACFLACLALALGGCAGGRRPVRSGGPASIITDSSAQRRESFAARLDSLLADTLLAQAQFGIFIVDASNGRPVYGRNFQRLLVPASVNKLFITSLALRRLGPQFRFTTAALGDSIDGRGLMRGDLFLVGSGDPSLTTAGLDEMAFRLRSAGLEKVSGKLVLDPGAFDTTKYGPGWMWDEGPYAYNAPISALSVNRNTFEIGISAGAKPGDRLKVSLSPSSVYFKLDNQGVTAFSGVKRSLKASRRQDGESEAITVVGVLSREESPQYLVRSVSDPIRYCGRLFREALRRQGITVAGGTVVGRAPQGLATLAALQSRPLYSILQDMNKESDNFTAEMLFRAITAGDKNTGGNGSLEYSGSMEAMMAGLGFGPGSHRIVDGSGLSRYNLCSPQHLVTVLMDMQKDESISTEFLVTLPVAGADGTLEKRMNGQGLQYRVRAKTGTMTGVSSLAGFALGSGGRRYCFALMFNNYTCGAGAIRGLQDRILAELISVSP